MPKTEYHLSSSNANVPKREFTRLGWKATPKVVWIEVRGFVNYNVSHVNDSRKLGARLLAESSMFPEASLLILAENDFNAFPLHSFYDNLFGFWQV